MEQVRNSIVLKDVEVGFDDFTKGSVYRTGAPLNYRGSVILDTRSKKFEKLNTTLVAFLKDKKQSTKKIQELMNKKIKGAELDEDGAFPNYVKNQQTIDKEDDYAYLRYLWTRTKFRPIISRFIQHELITINNEVKEVPSTHQIGVGARVNLEIIFGFSSEEGGILSVWPRAIHIKEQGRAGFVSDEWAEMIQEETKAQDD